MPVLVLWRKGTVDKFIMRQGGRNNMTGFLGLSNVCFLKQDSTHKHTHKPIQIERETAMCDRLFGRVIETFNAVATVLVKTRIIKPRSLHTYYLDVGEEFDELGNDHLAEARICLDDLADEEHDF
jgi:hypothetical protein